MGPTTPYRKKIIVTKPEEKKDKRKDLTVRTRKGKRIDELILGTWNVRTLYEAGRLKVLKEQMEKYKIGITALQEIRWKGSEKMDPGDYTIFYSGNQNYNIFGTGFLVHRKYKQAVIDFKAVNDRICTLRLKGKFFNLHLISVHAPTEHKDDEEKNTFYDKLEGVVDGIQGHDIKIILGDLNVKIGKETIHRPTIGPNSIHEESNGNGTRVIDFATSRI